MDFGQLGAASLASLPPYLYLQDLIRGRRVLEVGCGEGHGAAFLVQLGAASVVAVDRSARVIEAAQARFRLADLEFRVSEYRTLDEVDDRSFDLVAVPHGGNLVRDDGFLEEARRVLVRGGHILVHAPNGDRKDLRGGVSYQELAAALEQVFDSVRMMAVQPFVGLSLVELGEGESRVAELDGTFLGDDTEPISSYLAIAGPVSGPPREFLVVRLPSETGICVVGDLRVRELEAALAQAERQKPVREDAELRRRLAKAVEERTAAVAEAQELSTRLAEAQVELGRVAAQAAVELEQLKAQPGLRADAAEVERLGLALSEREAALARFTSERQELAWKVEELEGRLRKLETRPGPEALVQAAERHESAMREKTAELAERDACVEELREELVRAHRAADTEAAAAREARDKLEPVAAELREARSLAARAEGELLRLQALVPASPPPGVAMPVAMVDEGKVADLTSALEKTNHRWREAEAKTDELWRKIGEMQRELEQGREQAVENARMQRQAAQVALTRAVDEASKRLVSVKDQLGRTERERQELENRLAQVERSREEDRRTWAAAGTTLGAAEERLSALDADLGDAAARLGELSRNLGSLCVEVEPPGTKAELVERDQRIGELMAGVADSRKRMATLAEVLRRASNEVENSSPAELSGFLERVAVEVASALDPEPKPQA